MDYEMKADICMLHMHMDMKGVAGDYFHHSWSMMPNETRWGHAHSFFGYISFK